jgi:RluA family pseudouridine synthase
VADVLKLVRADALAIGEGRVFVGRRRVKRADERVAPGDIVGVAAPTAAPPSVTVLFETDDLVAVDKPAGVPTIADHGGAAHALVALAARALSVDPETLHPTSRLDRDVSGVVVLARAPAAARRLADARAHGAYARRYVAIAARAPSPAQGTWEAPIGRAADPRRRSVGGRAPAPAVTRYATCGRTERGETLLAVAPVTGRTHQIRVHASNAGCPLLGDRAYGGPSRVTLSTGRVLEPRRIALHAALVTVPDSAGTPRTAAAPVPRELRTLWTDLGGDAADWDKALSCEV